MAKSRLFEMMQTMDTPEARAVIALENPTGDITKLTVDKLLTQDDLVKISEFVQQYGVAGVKLQKSLYNIHDKDQKEVPDLANGGKMKRAKLQHVHYPMLFEDEVTDKDLAAMVYTACGKHVPVSCFCLSTDGSNAPCERKFLSMAAYAIHAFQPYSGADRADALGHDLDHGYFFNGADFESIDTFAGDLSSMNVYAGSWKYMTYLYPIDSPVCYNCSMPQLITEFIQYREAESAKQKAKAVALAADTFLQDIADGKIREHEMHKVDFAIYRKAYREIPVALDYAYKHAVACSRDVLYIQGQSGDGKTTVAKMYCDAHGLSYYVTGTGDHAFDEYAGQDVIIWDDFRDSDMGFHDLLKMLDNNTDCTIAARYRNKKLPFCKMFILTSTKSINECYAGAAAKDGEQYVQFLRRVGTVLDIHDGKVTLWQYDKKKRKHVPAREGKYSFDPEKVFPEVDYAAKLADLESSLIKLGFIEGQCQDCHDTVGTHIVREIKDALNKKKREYVEMIAARNRLYNEMKSMAPDDPYLFTVSKYPAECTAGLEAQLSLQG